MIVRVDIWFGGLVSVVVQDTLYGNEYYNTQGNSRLSFHLDHHYQPC